MAVMTITWVTKDDTRVCPVCRPHHGTTWNYDTGTDAFPTTIPSPIGGYPMWDAVRDHSLAHLQLKNQGKGIPCRCVLDVDFDLTSMTTYLHQLRVRALEMHGEIEMWSTGKVLVLRHEGRFVSWRNIR